MKKGVREREREGGTRRQCSDDGGAGTRESELRSTRGWQSVNFRSLELPVTSEAKPQKPQLKSHSSLQ